MSIKRHQWTAKYFTTRGKDLLFKKKQQCIENHEETRGTRRTDYP